MTRPRTPSEILDAAGDLLAQPEAWTQGVGARDIHGIQQDCTSAAAVCWCAVGANARVANDDGAAMLADDYLSIAVGEPITNWNDAPDRTQSEVVAAFRKAAALAREAGE